MIRLAYFSPLNPVESGISDYSEELLPWLARAAEIDLFVDNYQPSNPEIRRQFAVHRGKEFEAKQRQRPYDAVLYHMGNSPAHAYIYHTLLKHKGIVVLHDYLLHHLMIWLAINEKRGKSYLREMENRYGREGLGVAQRMLKGQLPQAAFDYPLCEGVLEACQGVVVHNRYAEGLIRPAYPQLPIGRVNMGVPLPEEAHPAEVRQKLGIPEDQFLIVSLGHLNPYKRLDAALRAFKSFVVRHPRAIYVLAGSASPNYDVKRMVAQLDLADKVKLLGFVPAESYRDYVAAADICLNLRHPTAGETSASLLRMMGAGKPVLVSRTGSFTELPDDCCGKIDIDETEEDLLLEYLLFLAENPEAREQMGRNAREHVAREHNMAVATEGYYRFLSQLLGLPLDPKFATPEVGITSVGTQNLDITSHTQPVATPSIAEELATTGPSNPREQPLERHREDPGALPIETIQPVEGRSLDVDTANRSHEPEPDPEPEEWSLLAEVANHAADLGITECDDLILKELARAVLELEGDKDP